MTFEEELLDLLPVRRGHFRFESGHHGDLWLDLDALLLRPRALAACAAELAARLSAHGVEAACGPLVGGAFVAQMVAAELDVELVYTERSGGAYCVPPALRDRLRGRRVAIVDDAINAGSAVGTTARDLQACEAQLVALGALLVLGHPAARLAAELGTPLEHIAVLPNTLWEPSACPLCAAGAALGA